MEKRIEPVMGDLAHVDATDAPRVQGDLPRGRRPWLAALLGLLFPQVAMAYVGRLGMGLLLGVILLSVVAVMGRSGLIQGVAGYWGLAAFVVGWMLFHVGFPWWVARRHRRAYRLRWYNRWYAYALLALLFPLIYSGILRSRAELLGYATYRFASSSMATTLMPGDVVMVDTRAAFLREIRRNDLVVYRRATGPDFMHRVIGLPGEEIVVTAEGVTVDGVRLDEPFAHGPDYAPGMTATRLKLGTGDYYLMGDNREHSLDSRYIGPIGAADMLGRASAIVYSAEPGRIGPLR